MSRGPLTLDAVTPAQLAAALGWSERRVRDKARELGACRILGNRMVFLPQDVDTIMEATKCPSSSSSGKRAMEGISGTTAARLPAIDYEGRRAQRTARSRRELRPRSKTDTTKVISIDRKK